MGMEDKLQLQEMLSSGKRLCSHRKDQPQLSEIPRTGLALLVQLTQIKHKIQIELGNGFSFQEEREFLS